MASLLSATRQFNWYPLNTTSANKCGDMSVSVESSKLTVVLLGSLCQAWSTTQINFKILCDNNELNESPGFVKNLAYLLRWNPIDLLSIELLSRVVYGALGGDPFLLYTIDKYYTSNYFCQPLWTMETVPPFLCALTELKCHRNDRLWRKAVPYLWGAQPDGWEGGFYRICCAYMPPVFCREIVKGQQQVSIFFQTLCRLWILSSVDIHKTSRCFWASVLSGAIQIWWSFSLALGWMLFGNWFRTLAVLCTQHLCQRVYRPLTGPSRTLAPRHRRPI